MKSPVLFLIFNRPDTTAKVFEAIREARPPKLYIAADGPRPNRAGEKDRCEVTRAIATQVDWPCEVKKLFRDENLGCGKAVSEAITWFFENEPEGIILEDDILPHPDFFPYCDEMLEKYRDNDRVGIISGHNHIYRDLNRESSYGFLSIPHIWGWATWRNRWNMYDFNLCNTTENDLIAGLRKLGYNSSRIRFWKDIYRTMLNHKIDTWDYQWTITLMSSAKMNLSPYKSLTKNIGFNEDATHTGEGRIEEINLIPTGIYPIKYAKEIKLDLDADFIESRNEKTYKSAFGILKRRTKNLIKRVLNK